MNSQPQFSGRFERALVGLDRSDRDRGLLSYVAMLAGAGLIDEIQCVHIVPTAAADDSVERDELRAALKVETDRVLSALPASVRVTHEIRRGPLLDKLLVAIAENRSDVALIGHRQDHALRRSLARRLAKLAPCSIWLVPDGAPAAITRILAPIDFSPAAGHALRVAATVGQCLGVPELHAIHVYFDEARTTYEGHDEVIRGREASALAGFVHSLELNDTRIVPHYREASHPADAIRRVADEISANLVVMGTRGRSPSAAVLLGSVAQETLVASRVPVLVVRAPGPHVGLFRALMQRLWRHEPGVDFES